jgi:hypothetical protein
MRLRVSCKSCQRSFSPGVYESDRAALQQKHGNEISLTCPKCKSIHQYEMNRLFASPGFFPTIISLMLLIGGSIVLFVYFCNYLTRVHGVYVSAGLIGFLALPAIIFLFISNYEQKKCDDFNSYRI